MKKRGEKMRQTSGRGRRRDRRVMPPTLRYRSTSNSSNRNTQHVTSRLRMRPWLEQLLDMGACSTLRWENKPDKTFSIAWRHASSHGFNASQHGDLFLRWAQHTGKVTRNSFGNHTSNKSNFRCALHSLKDCIELTAKGDKRGEGAKRTYQFIDPGHSQYDTKRKRESQRRRKNAKINLEAEESDYKPDLVEYYQETEEYYPETEDCLEVPETMTTQSPAHLNLTGSSLMIPKLEMLAPGNVSTLIPETQPNGVIAITIQPSNTIEGSVICKEESLSAEILPKFGELGVTDLCKTNPIYHPKLSSGGIVKITKSRQETLNQPEFMINNHFLQLGSGQLQDFDAGILDYPLEGISMLDFDTEVTEDGQFGQINESGNVNFLQQNDTNGRRVLTIMQPIDPDDISSYAAMEEVTQYGDYSILSQDIFSVGIC